jgi:hypothetical protein
LVQYIFCQSLKGTKFKDALSSTLFYDSDASYGH